MYVPHMHFVFFVGRASIWNGMGSFSNDIFLNVRYYLLPIFIEEKVRCFD